MRCWLCGVEPDEVHEIRSFEDAQPRLILAGWAPGDHEHAERAPTPGQLEQRGHEALMRIQGEA